MEVTKNEWKRKRNIKNLIRFNSGVFGNDCGGVKMVTKSQIRMYNKIYNQLYENGYKSELVKIGEYFIKTFPAIIKEMILVRHDFITSDREYAAYAVWFMKYYNN